MHGVQRQGLDGTSQSTVKAYRALQEWALLEHSGTKLGYWRLSIINIIIHIDGL
jgi:hypothetical protein